MTLGSAQLPAGIALLAYLAATGLWSWRRRDRSVWLPALAALLAWIVAARLVGVIGEASTFARDPLAVFTIGGDGWSRPAGMAGFTLVCLVALLARPSAVAPLAGSAAAAYLAASFAVLLAPAPARGTLPDIALTTLGGEPVDLASRDGRPLVVNLWATWCGPCRREMPMMMQVAEREDGVDIVFANQGEAARTIAQFLVTMSLSAGDVVMDPDGALMRSYGTLGLPATLFFDAEGRIVEVHVGEIARPALLAGMSALRERAR